MLSHCIADAISLVYILLDLIAGISYWNYVVKTY